VTENEPSTQIRDWTEEMTERLLRDAGITAGMRVLDVGCANGDFTFAVARVVGERGAVIGLDREPRWLSNARERARQLGLENVDFIEADLLAAPMAGGAYDAVVGRRVLMYQPDRVLALRAVSNMLRPGGVSVFQEVDFSMGPAPAGSHPLHEQVTQWMRTTVAREGATTSMGFELHGAMEAVGLNVAGIRAEAVVQSARWPDPTAAIVRSMLPRLVAHGVASESEIDVDTLELRLADEFRRVKMPYIGHMNFSVWATKSS
jgi:ubiquinone/menaquinone biosynthesis C-methylase UbiE